MNDIFEVANKSAPLLVVMVTTTLTLVIISHRIRDKAKPKNQETLNQLNGIKVLIWAHLFVTVAITARIMLITLIAEDAGQFFNCFDKFIVIAIFLILGFCWPLYFWTLGQGKIHFCHQEFQNTITLDDDIAKIFRHSEAVNTALRAILICTVKDKESDLDN